ncbi:MAG TPA: hypothetical protein VLH77_03870, partial [Gammaproteobacteria bacterium]|nr:hypothetical protein [Gammaproteobacteria bacterium]
MKSRETAGLFTNKSVPLIGFGFFRKNIEQPWFSRFDFEEAVPNGPFKRLVIPSRSHIVELQKRLPEAGYMEVEEGSSGPNGGRHRVMMQLTDAATEPLLDYLAYTVTHAGLSLPDILFVPESVENILQSTN